MSRLSRELREQRRPHPKPENVVRGAARAANREVYEAVRRQLEGGVEGLSQEIYPRDKVPTEYHRQALLAAAQELNDAHAASERRQLERAEPPVQRVTPPTIPACLRRIT